MFFLLGEDIAPVRFSYRNQNICFMDWTEKRGEFGTVQNSTAPYEEGKNEYYFLLIGWIPTATGRELTDHAENGTASFPVELWEYLIVFEASFVNGQTDTKTIHIAPQDGGFFAAFGTYTVTKADDFVNRPDAQPILRDILHDPTPLNVTSHRADSNEVLSDAPWYNMTQINTMRVH